jgi:hypothetical protein
MGWKSLFAPDRCRHSARWGYVSLGIVSTRLLYSVTKISMHASHLELALFIPCATAQQRSTRTAANETKKTSFVPIHHHHHHCSVPKRNTTFHSFHLEKYNMVSALMQHILFSTLANCDTSHLAPRRPWSRQGSNGDPRPATVPGNSVPRRNATRFRYEHGIRPILTVDSIALLCSNSFIPLFAFLFIIILMIIIIMIIIIIIIGYG